jgi:hypothetical protein
MKTAEEILDKIHIKYLSKAKTAIIDGSELTVLPYGFLQEACKEAMKEYAEQACAKQREICISELRDKIGCPQKGMLPLSTANVIGNAPKPELL